MGKIKVILGDPRHNTRGVHSPYIPVGLGYIATYLISQFEDHDIEVRISTKPEELFKWIEDWQPHVVGLSSYIWNSRLSYRICEFAKEINTSTLCVMGGPEFPSGTGQVNLDETRSLCLDYMLKRNALDYYCFSDGEAGFVPLMEKFIEYDIDALEMRRADISIDGFVSLDSASKNLLGGRPALRIGMDNRFGGRDIIPSPYLNGLLDNFLD